MGSMGDNGANVRSGGGWRNRPSAAERGYGRGWKALRKRVMARDKWLCQVSLREGRIVPATEVDHIIPKHLGGTDDMANLQAISAEAHRRKTEREAAEAQGRKARVTFGEDGWPVE